MIKMEVRSVGKIVCRGIAFVTPLIKESILIYKSFHPSFSKKPLNDRLIKCGIREKIFISLESFQLLFTISFISGVNVKSTASSSLNTVLFLVSHLNIKDVNRGAKK